MHAFKEAEEAQCYCRVSFRLVLFIYVFLIATKWKRSDDKKIQHNAYLLYKLSTGTSPLRTAFMITAEF